MSDNYTLSAADTLRARAEAAEIVPGERYIVDTSDEHGLIVGVYGPADVDLDSGAPSTGCVAYFAYPDDENRSAYAHALDVAALMAGMDPLATKALADTLDLIASAWDELPERVRAAVDRFAHAYLKDRP